MKIRYYGKVMVRMVEQVHLLISGEVQGVSYRWYAARKARELGLKGYVHNLPDGRVEIVAEGESELLKELACWAWEGSPSSAVSDVSESWSVATNRWQSFHIAP